MKISAHQATVACLTLAAAIAASSLAAQPYPARPVRMIVPQSAGGSTDVVARLIAQRMSDSPGQPIVVDNRPGAGSLNGIEIVANAAPDGYTLLAVAASFTINPALHRKLPFDPVNGFTPISQLVTLPHVLVVHPSMPISSVKQLIALARARPGEMNFSVGGPGSSGYLGALLFNHLYYPMMERDALKQGELPLWNRYSLGGMPLLGQGQSLFGEPLNFIPILADGAAWAWDVHLDHGTNGAGARTHDEDAVRQQHGLRDVVRDQHHGVLDFGPDSQDFDIHLLAGLRIERAERLVQQQDWRVERECPRERRALLHATGQIAGIEGLEAMQANQAN